MNATDLNVKKDLFYIYETLYASIPKDSATLYDNRLVKKLKYAPDLIASVLNLNDEGRAERNDLKIKRTEPTSDITNIDDLREFYYSNLKSVYDNSLDDDSKRKILDPISLAEFKRLYSIIFDTSIPSRATKMDIVDILRYFFSDEARTIGLAKGL